MSPTQRGLNILQKISMSLMGVLVLITFVGANLQAILWQSSEWLVSTVLPAVVVDMTNQERSGVSEQPLVRSETLDKAAKLKAQHMAKNQYFSHFSPDGVSPWHWFDEAGYVYAHAGENLAIHFTDSSEVVEAWMDSPTHRANIVSGKYTEIGVGTAKGKFDGYDTVYVVQLFGTPAVPPAPVASEPLAVATTPEVPVPATVVTETEVVSEEIADSLETPATGVEVVLSEESELVIEKVSEVTSEETNEVESAEVVKTQSDVVIENKIFDTVAVSVEEDYSEVIVVESPVISTSSGLAVASINTTPPVHAGGTIASVITQPNSLLQIVYFVLATAVVMMLGASVVIEARRLRFEQVAYGLLLLMGMGGLWFVNSILTTGAVVV
ncbi:hypothetical protein H6781_01350 [Candidatus Nomurabacteria bacterium]|nr:hypothetical protein [Candidatus Nomurabacteria bacterium]MCB9818124.1 hypothetical protein [Candidatus Nomurabacteria bacterium]